MKKFNAFYQSKLAEVNDQLDGCQTLIKDKLNIVESKKEELINQLDKQKQNFLQGKLKGLFNK